MWPALRDELALLAGAPLADGQPSHTLHDPVANLYFQIDWPTFEVLSRWHLADAEQIAQAVSRDTTLELDVNDVEQVLHFLQTNQLLQPPVGSARELAARLAKRRGSWLQWLLHNYLFFRVPLVRPDHFLGWLSDRTSFLFTRGFLGLTLGALALGLVEIARDWERFAATLIDTLTWSGMASYAVTLAAIKVLHEIGHGLVAKRYGCRIPTMGLAFLVLWPVAYTDTNEVWKLTQRRQRLAVAAAGMATELLIAVWSTLAWALLPDGSAKNMAFLLATTTWIMSIAVNASPFMRFDGYFLLADALEIPNLHQRAFALARWDMRERLFQLGLPVPEVFPPKRHVGLILFAYATWTYRLVVFLGIATLVYTFFIKAVGIVLFLVEMGWFVIAPFYREFMVWRQLWPVLRTRARARRTAAIASALCLLFVVPWPSPIASTGLLRPEQQWLIYAPERAQVLSLPIKDGDQVKAGTPLMTLTSAELESRQSQAQARIRRTGWQASAGVFDAEQRSQWQSAQEEWALAQAEQASLQADAARYTPTAPFDGQLRDVDPDLKPGTWLTRDEVLGRLVAGDARQVVTYLDEEQVGRVSVGDTARFYTDAAAGNVMALKVTRIDRDATRVLPEAELSSTHGGTLQVRERKGNLYPDRSLYRVTLLAAVAPDDLAGHTWRGHVVIHGRWVSPGATLARHALGLFWREAGF